MLKDDPARTTMTMDTLIKIEDLSMATSSEKFTKL